MIHGIRGSKETQKETQSGWGKNDKKEKKKNKKEKTEVLAVDQRNKVKKPLSKTSGSRIVKISENKAKEEIDILVLFDTGSRKANLVDKGKLERRGMDFERREADELPHLIAANRQRIHLIGLVKLFVRLEEHKRRKLVLFYVTPSKYDVCLLSMSTFRGLNWGGCQWPSNIPEINSDEERKSGRQNVYKVRNRSRSTSDSEEVDMGQRGTQEKHYVKRRPRRELKSKKEISSNEEDEDSEKDENSEATFNRHRGDKPKEYQKESSLESREDSDTSDYKAKWSPMASGDELRYDV